MHNKPKAACGRNRTSNIEQSTSNIERKDISNFDVQCSMFDVHACDANASHLITEQPNLFVFLFC